MKDKLHYSWYRGPKSAWHAARPDWVYSGKTMCGWYMKFATFIIMMWPDEPTATQDRCKHCIRMTGHKSSQTS